MILPIIADDENVAQQVPELPADLLLSLGDLPDETILRIAGRCGCREILAVKGNHDGSAPFAAPIRGLHLKTFAFRGVRFGGFCGVWKYKPKGNHLFEQGDVERLMRGFPPVDVFLAHNSPRLIHDREDDVHTGFVAFNNYITKAAPKLFLHGHQHENVETKVGITRVIGTFGHRFLEIQD